MSEDRLLDLVNAHEFRDLFVDELGWNNPDRPDVTVTVEESIYTLTPVASYKGLRIWHCPQRPPRKIQRQIDVLVGKDNQERLIVFTDDGRQDWRWPRRAQLTGANAKLLVHEHVAGDRNTHLTTRLRAIALDLDHDISLVALLEKMRDAFDREAETAAVAAARLMGRLYSELDAAQVDAHDATLLLARLLFVLFGDDADMWKPGSLFERWLSEHTSADTLHNDLVGLFEVLNTPENRRSLPEGSPLQPFRYINGGLYADPLALQPLPPAFRDALLEACQFNWSTISPAVFGSMFQTVKDRVARRTAGEHYTTEHNILKTIRPLFLDEYRNRLDQSWDSPTKLKKLHNDLAEARYLDPACGCGNFLVVAYRELRALELEILKRLRDLAMVHASNKKVERAQLSLDVTKDVKVTMDHFFGIEIEEWPARIAETAMLLVNHLANQQMAIEFGVAPDPLPITVAPTIIHGNALRVNWNTVVPASPVMVVFGNPPYAGKKQRTAQQTADMQHVWGSAYSGEADYVTSWFTKAVNYFGDTPGRWAFVSTNSVAQGVVVAPVFGDLFARGWRITFAHRTFAWSSEAVGEAIVHCVIVGMSNRPARRHRLFEYPTPTSQPIELDVPTINAYLVNGPNVLVTDRRDALNPQLDSDIRFGSMAADGRPTADDGDGGGGLLVKHTEYIELDPSDTVAAKYLRPFVGARELLHGTPRWCIWIPDDKLPADVANSPFLQARIEHVHHFRSEVAKDAGVRAAAATPWRFNRVQQPTSAYLCIPRHVSENYRYYPAARFEPDIISGDHNFVVNDPAGFFFALISSSMFLTWQHTVGGRIKSDPRFASTYTWNTLPLPTVDSQSRRQIIQAGKQVLAARALHPSRSLAEHYDPDSMDPELVAAHRHLDELVDAAFGATDGCQNRLQRQEILFTRYAALTPRR